MQRESRYLITKGNLIKKLSLIFSAFLIIFLAEIPDVSSRNIQASKLAHFDLFGIALSDLDQCPDVCPSASGPLKWKLPFPVICQRETSLEVQVGQKTYRAYGFGSETEGSSLSVDEGEFVGEDRKNATKTTLTPEQFFPISANYPLLKLDSSSIQKVIQLLGKPVFFEKNKGWDLTWYWKRNIQKEKGCQGKVSTSRQWSYGTGVTMHFDKKKLLKSVQIYGNCGEC